LDVSAAPEIVPSGSVLGPISAEFSQLPAFHETQVIVPACHDTASAIAAIPAAGDDWAFISSGTWSLVGTVLDAPCVTSDAQSLNFTNLGGVGGRICFLKNVNGMWLLRQCMEEWEQHGIRLSFQEMLSRCASLPVPAALIDIDDPQLMVPGHAIQKINAPLERLGQPEFTLDDASIPSLANTSARYGLRYTGACLIAKITGKKLRRLFVGRSGSVNQLALRALLELVLVLRKAHHLNFAVHGALGAIRSSPPVSVIQSQMGGPNICNWRCPTNAKLTSVRDRCSFNGISDNDKAIEVIKAPTISYKPPSGDLPTPHPLENSSGWAARPRGVGDAAQFMLPRSHHDWPLHVRGTCRTDWRMFRGPNW
jgi:hypothetical protein